MLKNFRDKIALSGMTVLMIGIALLIFTFVSAYGFLYGSLSIIASQDLVQTFGEALAPLIATCIRVMYLGVMGWLGSLVTIRGVTIIAHTPQGVPLLPQKEAAPGQKPQPQPQPQTQKVNAERSKAEKPRTEKPKEEKPQEPAKSPEPEFIVIPPERLPVLQPEQGQPEQGQPQQSQPQQNHSPPQPSN